MRAGATLRSGAEPLRAGCAFVRQAARRCARGDLAMKMVLIGAAAALGLAACGQSEPAPQGSTVGAAMPDTSAPRAPDAAMTAPDAGATGVVPADGSEPAVAETPPVGTAGGASDAAAPAPAPAGQ
jgi:hypothetical protein